jgi:hypothetical protein
LPRVGPPEERPDGRFSGDVILSSSDLADRRPGASGVQVLGAQTLLAGSTAR